MDGFQKNQYREIYEKSLKLKVQNRLSPHYLNLCRAKKYLNPGEKFSDIDSKN